MALTGHVLKAIGPRESRRVAIARKIAPSAGTKCNVILTQREAMPFPISARQVQYPRLSRQIDRIIGPRHPAKLEDGQQ